MSSLSSILDAQRPFSSSSAITLDAYIDPIGSTGTFKGDDFLDLRRSSVLKKMISFHCLLPAVLGHLKVGEGASQTLQQPTVLLIILTRSDDGTGVGARHVLASL